MSDCLFCDIVAGSISSEIVLDREQVLAFHDIAPAAPVHLLVVPKEHIGDVRDVTAEHGPLLAQLLDAANVSARDAGLSEGGYRLVFNVGPDAGQTVFHLHVHVLGGANLGPMAG
jgi:histidine triad (HIT) family protein